MSSLSWSFLLLFLGLGLFGWIVWMQSLFGRARMRSRLFSQEVANEEEPPSEEERGLLANWLFLAGYRSRSAWLVFLGITLLLTALGGGVVAFAYWMGAVDTLVQLLTIIPGGVGEVFLPFAYLSPWLTLLFLGTLPAVMVRAARKRRVRQVEQDLPVTLDLLATLAQGGLGFDAALAKVLEGLPPERPLAQEFRTYQIDMLAGRPRVQALRRLAKRLDVTWFTIFISAVVQAEQIGSGLAEVLRNQAEDLRRRRRERAMAFAMTVPVKLLFPLILCFLPGIFVVVLGPPFYQIIQTIDSMIAPYQV